MVILGSVLEVKFTKYCTCAAENPVEGGIFFPLWTWFSFILKSDPYMLEAYFRNKNKRTKQIATISMKQTRKSAK